MKLYWIEQFCFLKCAWCAFKTGTEPLHNSFSKQLLSEIYINIRNVLDGVIITITIWIGPKW